MESASLAALAIMVGELANAAPFASSSCSRRLQVSVPFSSSAVTLMGDLPELPSTRSAAGSAAGSAVDEPARSAAAKRPGSKHDEEPCANGRR
eukprot:2082302-Pyramimonas_sp.AAC.2